MIFCSILFLFSCGDNKIDRVKKSTLGVETFGGSTSFDRSTLLGDVYDNYKYFKSVVWDSFKDEQNRDFVELKAELDLNSYVGTSIELSLDIWPDQLAKPTLTFSENHVKELRKQKGKITYYQQYILSKSDDTADAGNSGFILESQVSGDTITIERDDMLPPRPIKYILTNEQLPIFYHPSLTQFNNWMMKNIWVEDIKKLQDEMVNTLITKLDDTETSSMTAGGSIIWNKEIRLSVSKTLLELGEVHEKVISTLLEIYKSELDRDRVDKDFINEIYGVLVGGGEDVVDHIIPLLQNDDYVTRNFSLRILLHSGVNEKNVKTVIPELIKILKDRDRTNRYLSVQVLGGLGEDAKEAIPYLKETLQDVDVFVSEDDMSLYDMGYRIYYKDKEIHRDGGTVDLLNLRHKVLLESTGTYFFSAWALGEIGKVTVPVINEVLQDCIDKIDKVVEDSIDGSISFVNLESKDYLEIKKSIFVCEVLLRALSTIGEDSTDTVPTLIRLLEVCLKVTDPSSQHLYELDYTSPHYSKEGWSDAPELVYDVCVRVVNTLGKMGEGIKDVVPTLTTILQRELDVPGDWSYGMKSYDWGRGTSYRLFLTTLETLYRIGKNAKTVTPVLSQLVQERERIGSTQSGYSWMWTDERKENDLLGKNRELYSRRQIVEILKKIGTPESLKVVDSLGLKLTSNYR